MERDGQILDARISTGIHVFSKNKQRSSLGPAPGATGRPRTGSQWLETAGGSSAVPYWSGSPSRAGELSTAVEGEEHDMHAEALGRSPKRRGSDVSSPLNLARLDVSSAEAIKRQRSANDSPATSSPPMIRVDGAGDKLLAGSRFTKHKHACW